MAKGCEGEVTFLKAGSVKDEQSASPIRHARNVMGLQDEDVDASGSEDDEVDDSGIEGKRLSLDKEEEVSGKSRILSFPAGMRWTTIT